MTELVGQLLVVIGFYPASVMQYVVVTGSNRALSNTLGHNKEIVPVDERQRCYNRIQNVLPKCHFLINTDQEMKQTSQSKLKKHL